MINFAKRSRTISSLAAGFCVTAAVGLGAIGAPVRSSSTAPRDFVSLESLNYDEVCGEDAGGQTRCTRGGPEATWIPDSVGMLKYAFSNQRISCGIDEDGVKCWRLYGGPERFAGQSESAAVRQLLNEANLDSVRLSATNICATTNKSRQLKCLAPDWGATTDKTISISSLKEIHTFAVSDFILCWAERESGSARPRNSNSKISCQVSFPKIVKLPAIPDFKGLTEISVGFDWVCARSKTEARCWSEDSAVTLDVDMVKAKSWHSAHTNLCVLAADNRVICIDPKTGTSDPSSSGHTIPQEYSEPNSDIESLWMSADRSCILTPAKKALCWNRWATVPESIDFGPKLSKIFGEGVDPCGLTSDGQVECRFFYLESRTLSKSDRVRVEFGGYNKCFWNSSGVDCRGRYDDIKYRSVKTLSASREQESVCVIGVRADQASDFETVQCYTYYPELNTPPFELSNPTAVATSDDKACAISDEGLTCWGTAYDDVPMPTSTLNPKKVLMGRRHACALDDFGLVCWGELAAFDLEVPSDLQQPDRIIDFALGASRTCAVLDTGNVECWGRDYELSGPPPRMTNVKSIAGRGGLFCALDDTRLRCWGGETELPK